MSFEIRPFQRENEHVLIALAGPSGGGKTLSSLKLARGLAQGGKIGFVDTERGRGRHYADGDTAIIYGMLTAPFSPEAYTDAAKKMEQAGAAVIIIDSMSLEWSGEGGCLEMQEAELDRMAGQDWGKRDRARMSAWIRPKMAHKKMVGRLLQMDAHLIFTLRAEEKVRPEKGPDGKTVIVPLGWMPICEKNWMYEQTASFMLSDTERHLATPIKLQAQHRTFFPPDKPIGEESGGALAKWARGAGVETTPETADAQSIYDEIVAFARSTTDSAALRTAWQHDGSVHVLKRTNADLYAQAHKIVTDRLKELRA